MNRGESRGDYRGVILLEARTKEFMRVACESKAKAKARNRRKAARGAVLIRGFSH